ncbi:MAG: three-Cys-motif partner protein TcmP [Polyangiaceae bacterium]
MEIPEMYKGREQSLLKHRVLEEYLTLWGHKLGAVARERPLRLCYVDGFAGPWNHRGDKLEDTSIAIGLSALEKAEETWRKRGADIRIDAFFVEKDRASFGALQQYLSSRTGRVNARPYLGKFEDHVGAIERELGTDAAFVFVDPTGWKGAAMRYMAPLLRQRRRDVLVNVMFDHINRFKDDARSFLREQMRDFFGLADGDLPEGLDEEQLFSLYRANLKARCGVKFAADLAIPHPTDERTKFRLVVGGSSTKVLEVFRTVEQKVIGKEAAPVREDAAVRKTQDRTGQLSLLATPPPLDPGYQALHERGLDEACREVLALLEAGPRPFADIWPTILESHHLTKVDLAQEVWRLSVNGELVLTGKMGRERTTKDSHILSKR